ncbi:uncharacterized protein LOC135141854 [Zophobas morio]|uniref:uncharacterized protein LOC135141854 n=1 Tax=Zophobas morio TaxID=2755281 RepID=UPI003083C442
MALPKLALLGFWLTVAANVMDVLRPKTIRIYKFEGVCSGYENAPITLRDIHLIYSNKIHLISLVCVGKENISEDLKLKLDLKRCQSREALDSCEKYQTININHLCRLINAENKPWSPLVKLANPPMQCPVRKGVRVVKNGTFDGSAFSHLPIAGWYWIVTAWALGEETNRVLMCVNFEGQLVSS